MKIVVTGYTYTRENLFDVFNYYPEKDNLHFILPSRWTAKGGKVVFKKFTKEGFDIHHSAIFFSHSDYPIIGGLLKGWMPFMIFRLIYLRFTGEADILFTTGEPNLLSTLYNGIWAKLLGMKHVFHYWENIPYEQKDKGLKLFMKILIIRANMALSDGAICGMHKAEDILKKIKPKFYTEVFLHAGFDTEKFKPNLQPKLRERLNIGNSTVFLFVGALSYRKGIHLALEALRDLIRHHPNLFFLIIGSGEYEDSLKSKTEELGLSQVVKYIPWMPNEELPNVFCSSDVFLYPSIPHNGWEEQFGYSIAEASLCGLPVISTKSGSIYEVLLDGKTGIMVEPDNLKELTQAMEKLITDRELRTTLGKNGRKFIEDNYSNTIIARKLSNLFRKIYESRTK